MEYNSRWFKQNLEKLFTKYKLTYRYFPEGDLGSLDEVAFESEKVGGAINYWGKGYLGIFIYDYRKEIEIMNVLLSSEQNLEKEKFIKKMLTLLNL